MALGNKSMTIAMKTAWAVSKVTGISIAKTSAFTLKAVWKLVGGIKK